jgi:hypothetical protein
VRRFRADRWLALASACWAGLACSVFPDRAVLPESDAGGGFAGTLLAGAAGAIGGSQATGGNAGANGELAGTAGDAAGGAAGETAGGAAGETAGGAAGSSAAGAAATAGAGGTAGCASVHVVLPATADAWIAAAQPQVNHGSDTQLFVLGGASEQRALLAFSLPAAQAGDTLLAAKLTLTLSQAPNLGAQSRTLNAHSLTQTFNEGRVTWSNYSNGAAHQWATPGGDIGTSFGSGTLTSGAAQLVLDVTALVKAAYSAKQAELGLLVRDPAPAAPVSFAFVSREGVMTAQPALDLEYCRP